MVDMLDSLARLHITLQKQEEVKLLQMSCSMVSDRGELGRRARSERSVLVGNELQKGCDGGEGGSVKLNAHSSVDATVSRDSLKRIAS